MILKSLLAARTANTSIVLCCSLCILLRLAYYTWQSKEDGPSFHTTAQCHTRQCEVPHAVSDEWTVEAARQSKLGANITPPPRLTLGERFIPDACADLWIARGLLCDKIEDAGLAEAQISAVWSMVYDTPHWQAWKDYYSSNTTKARRGVRSQHFRSHEQLKFSIRSALQYLPFISDGTILAASLPTCSPPKAVANGTSAGCRLTQTPTWFDISTAASSKIRLLSHWKLFRLPMSTDDSQWKTDILPTFNSHAIESQLGHVDTSSDVIVYSNDDMAFGQPFSPADFSSTLFGPVYRIDDSKWSQGQADPRSLAKLNSQTRSRATAVTLELVDRRFGKRRRPWLEHVSYTLAPAMTDEVLRTWDDEIRITAESRFRGRSREIFLPLLATMYNIEKHREALLWSFIVARSDHDGSGSLSQAEKQQMLDTLGGQIVGDKIGIRTPLRAAAADTEENEVVAALMLQTGVQPPLATRYRFSSNDGYPFIGQNSSYPVFDGRYPVICTMRKEVCFGSDFLNENATTSDAQGLFKNVAFRHPKCGDCMIIALLAASGETGFSAFLPTRSASQSVKPASKLPLHIGNHSKDWQAADFSLPEHAQTDHQARRLLAVRLIQRYSYVLGESDIFFDAMKGDPERTREMLRDATDRRPAFLAINDALPANITAAEARLHEKCLHQWQSASWPQAASHERTFARIRG